MAESPIRLQILTPQRLLMETQVDSVISPSVNGYLEVLKDHAPMVVALDVGVLQFGAREDRRKAAVSGGMMLVRDNQVTVFADSAELAADIDVIRARSDLQGAREQLRNRLSRLEQQRAELELKKAINRLKVAGASE